MAMLFGATYPDRTLGLLPAEFGEADTETMCGTQGRSAYGSPCIALAAYLPGDAHRRAHVPREMKPAAVRILSGQLLNSSDGVETR